MKSLKKLIDSTIGVTARHLSFAIARPFYSIFFNISCSDKSKLQDQPGAIVISNHVSRHDGPLILSVLYTVTRIRPTAYYAEYNNWLQRIPMMLFGTIPMSSPKDWAPEKRIAHRQKTYDTMNKIMDNGNSVLIFPQGGIRKGDKEEIPDYLSGTYSLIQRYPNRPVVVITLDGLGQTQEHIYDRFFTFIGRRKGRRHVNVNIEVFENVDTSMGQAKFNKMLEDYWNHGYPIKTK